MQINLKCENPRGWADTTLGLGGVGGQTITEGPCWECAPCQLRIMAAYISIIRDRRTVKLFPLRLQNVVEEVLQELGEPILKRADDSG